MHINKNCDSICLHDLKGLVLIKDNGSSHVEYLKFSIGTLKKELNIFGSRNSFTKDFEELIDLVASGKVDILKMVSGVYDTDNAKEAFDALANNDGSLAKLLIKFSDGE